MRRFIVIPASTGDTRYDMLPGSFRFYLDFVRRGKLQLTRAVELPWCRDCKTYAATYNPDGLHPATVCNYCSDRSYV